MLGRGAIAEPQASEPSWCRSAGLIPGVACIFPDLGIQLAPHNPGPPVLSLQRLVLRIIPLFVCGRCMEGTSEPAASSTGQSERRPAPSGGAALEGATIGWSSQDAGKGSRRRSRRFPSRRRDRAQLQPAAGDLEAAVGLYRPRTAAPTISSGESAYESAYESSRQTSSHEPNWQIRSQLEPWAVARGGCSGGAWLQRRSMLPR